MTDAERGDVLRLLRALRVIERWSDFPATRTGRSFGAEYGSKGEQDHMRAIARGAILGLSQSFVREAEENGGSEARQRAQVCADHGCQVIPGHQHAARITEAAKVLEEK